MSLRSLFTKNPNIVINTDIDGFLCGMILQKYYGCRVVGFSNSRETVWLTPEIQDIDSPIFIDLYVTRPNVICIEQHIIAYDSVHHNQIIGYGTKYNPNLDRTRTFVGDMGSDYYHKYPFGTVHYLIMLMAKEGIHVELPNLSFESRIRLPYGGTQHMGMSAGQIILRADDALSSTLSRYKDNAVDWWAWMDPDHRIPAIEALRTYISTCDPNRYQFYKNEIGKFFLGLGCDGIDGAYDVIADADGNILQKVLYYKEVISSITNMELFLPEHYIAHRGTYATARLSFNSDTRILHQSNLYSYAFIFGPHGYKQNFSFTLDL